MSRGEGIDENLARALVARQFPQWSELAVELVVPGGHDNRTFRLGEELSIRLPTADGYVAGELKEHEWLPRLAPQLPLPIPEVVGVGEPSDLFARPWSVRSWIAGDTASDERVRDSVDFARQVAEFIVALQGADASGGPAAGAQSFYRGADVSFYDAETRASLAAVADELGERRTRLAEEMWNAAISTSWDRPPVWFHGDIAWGNLIVRDGRLAAVIDFGTSGVGDPACDLVYAWTTLRGDAQRVYLDTIGLDDDTVARSKGWALWKALIVLDANRETNQQLAAEARQTLSELLP